MHHRLALVIRIWAIAGTSLSVLARCSTTSTAADTLAQPPITVFWDGGNLAAIRTGKFNDDSKIKNDLRQLRANANGAMKRGPYSVLQKVDIATSGDKHDYL